MKMNRWDKHRHLKIFIFPFISLHFSALYCGHRTENRVGEAIQSPLSDDVCSFSFVLMVMNSVFEREKLFQEVRPYTMIRRIADRKGKRDEKPIYLPFAIHTNCKSTYNQIANVQGYIFGVKNRPAL
jgi:hypothetical protein